MRFKFTLFLLTLNLITFGLIYFLSIQAEHNEGRNRGLAAMIGRKAVETDRIELSGKHLKSPHVLERKGSTWTITEPMQWSANYFAVNRILNQLQFLEEDASFSVAEIEETGQSLSEYGLEDPWVTLTLGRDDSAVVLSVGKPTEIGDNVYLLGPSQQDIFVVDRQVVDSLLVGLADLRTREIFDIPVFEVEALSLQIKPVGSPANGDLKVRLARSNNGWIFEAPLAAEADPGLVSDTINTLTAAKIVEFNEDSNPDPTVHGLDTPTLRVTLHGNKRRQTLLLGNPGPTRREIRTYYARLENNPTVFTVDAKPFDELREAQEGLRERNFMNFDREALTAINVSEKNLKIRLQKLETGDWQVIEGEAGPNIQPYRADPKIIEQLITGLQKLRASGFAVDAPTAADLQRLGFDEPRRRVRLSMSGGKEMTLLLAQSENDTLYARNDRAEYIYQVERQPTLRLLPLNVLYYRNRILDSLPEAARIESLKLENIETGEVLFEQTLGNPDARWENTLGEIPEEESAALLHLLEKVRKFEVESYLHDNYQDAYPVDAEKTRPWVYRLTAGIVLPGGDTARRENRVYVFTDRLSGSVQVGGSKSHNAMFEIPQDTIDALYAITEDEELPPEASGAPVPEPETVEPVPEPAPIPEAIP